MVRREGECIAAFVVEKLVYCDVVGGGVQRQNEIGEEIVGFRSWRDLA